MHETGSELPVLLEAGDVSERGAECSEMRVALVFVSPGTDFSPLLRGRPNDECQRPRWCYVLKGRLRLEDARSEEVLSGGDFYYLPSGQEETKFLEVAPPHLHQEFRDAAISNLAGNPTS